MTNINNNVDVLDSRDIIDRIEEMADDEEIDEADKAELELLKALVEEIRDYGGDTPEYGITLISDSYFEEYAEDFARDIGAISSGVQWPLDCIDWDEAASQLKMNYSSVDFDGVVYWYR